MPVREVGARGDVRVCGRRGGGGGAGDKAACRPEGAWPSARACQLPALDGAGHAAPGLFVPRGPDQSVQG